MQTAEVTAALTGLETESDMLRPLENAPALHPGEDREYPVLKNCPDCGGRGWFCENPFAEYNKRYRACPTCLDSKRHFEEYGELPADIAAAMVSQVSGSARD